MEVVQENPLQIEIDIPKNQVPINIRNKAGRPSKKKEIKFDSPPKSIISLLLSNKINKDVTDKTGSKIILSMDNELTQNLIPGDQCEQTVYNDNRNIELQKDRIYKCKHLNCSYSTRFSFNLKTHQRIHTSEHPYICDKCPFRSNFINSLKTHKRLHKNEKPFACKCCDYQCNSSSNLKKHISRKHTDHSKDK